MVLSLQSLDNMGNVDDFVKAYRDSLLNQYNTSLSSIQNNRRLEEANIMANANRSGMMYSNFPQRAKMQYLTSTYLPGIVEARTSYQTGLDKLRSNAVSVANNIKSIEDAIADLNKV